MVCLVLEEVAQITRVVVFDGEGVQSLLRQAGQRGSRFTIDLRLSNIIDYYLINRPMMCSHNLV